MSAVPIDDSAKQAEVTCRLSSQIAADGSPSRPDKTNQYDVQDDTNGLTKESITKLNPSFALEIGNKVLYNNDLGSWAAIRIANQYVD